MPSIWPALARSPDGFVEASDQRVYVERLFQHAKRPRLEQASAFLFGANRRHEDGGDTMATRHQPILKVASVHAGHLPIADKARCAHNDIRVQIILSGSESGDVVIHGNNEGFQSVAKTSIIVDNTNQKLL
jgi:hypothetical protein